MVENINDEIRAYEHNTSHTHELAIQSLPEADKIEPGDFIVIEKPSGTRKIREDHLASIKTPIEHSLDSKASYKALSAGMGNELKRLIDSIEKVLVIDNLLSLDKRAALSANQGNIIKNMIDKIPKIQVIDRLDSTATNYALSANQGNELRKMIEDISSAQIAISQNYKSRSENQTLSACAIHELVNGKNSEIDIPKIDGLFLIDNELKLIVDGKQVGPSVEINSGTGTSGLSAYEIACKNGFRGTEVEWLHTLVMDMDYVIESGILTNSLKNIMNCEKFPTQLCESGIFVTVNTHGELVKCTDIRDVVGVLLDNGLCKYSGCVKINVDQNSKSDIKIGKYIKPYNNGYGVVSDYEGFRIVKVQDNECTILLK